MIARVVSVPYSIREMRPTYPESPRIQEVPVDEGHLLNASTAKPSRIAPRYSTEDLRLCLPDFSIERVRLLGNGMQEYLFRR